MDKYFFTQCLLYACRIGVDCPNTLINLQAPSSTQLVKMCPDKDKEYIQSIQDFVDYLNYLKS